MKRKVVSAIVASLLLVGNVYAKDEGETLKLDTTKSVKEVNQNAVKEGKERAISSQVKLIEEAVTSLKLTHEALDSLEKKDSKKAQEKIEKALGKLEVILSAKDAPKVLPIDNIISLYEYVGTKESVEKSLESVKELLKDGKVQVARELLSTLRSEIDVTVISLPLATYPDALKLAAQYLHDGEIEKAKGILGIALSTFDRVTQVVPIPLIKAIDLVAVSEALAKKGEKKRALEYLQSAQDELDVAKVLGYVSHSDHSYKSLRESIKAVKKEIEGKNKAEKLFDTLKEKLKDFKQKVFSEKSDS
jgi:tetratricopeptide (TPR) repeat protein